MFQDHTYWAARLRRTVCPRPKPIPGPANYQRRRDYDYATWGDRRK